MNNNKLKYGYVFSALIASSLLISACNEEVPEPPVDTSDAVEPSEPSPVLEVLPTGLDPSIEAGMPFSFINHNQFTIPLADTTPPLDLDELRLQGVVDAALSDLSAQAASDFLSGLAPYTAGGWNPYLASTVADLGGDLGFFSGRDFSDVVGRYSKEGLLSQGYFPEGVEKYVLYDQSNFYRAYIGSIEAGPVVLDTYNELIEMESRYTSTTVDLDIRRKEMTRTPDFEGEVRLINIQFVDLPGSNELSIIYSEKVYSIDEAGNAIEGSSYYYGSPSMMKVNKDDYLAAVGDGASEFDWSIIDLYAGDDIGYDYHAEIRLDGVVGVINKSDWTEAPNLDDLSSIAIIDSDLLIERLERTSGAIAAESGSDFYFKMTYKGESFCILYRDVEESNMDYPYHYSLRLFNDVTQETEYSGRIDANCDGLEDL